MDVAQPSDGLSPRPPGRSMIGDLMWTYLAILIGLPGGFAVDLGMRQLGVVYDGGLSFPLFAIVIGPVTVLVVVLAIGPHPPRTLVRLVGGYIGWLAFVSTYFGLYLWQLIFAPLRGSGLLGVLGWVLSVLVAAAFIAGALLASESVRLLAHRFGRGGLSGDRRAARRAGSPRPRRPAEQRAPRPHVRRPRR